MNEMLGNQYFLARKYEKAAALLEEVLRNDPSNKPVRRKLIICYTQTGDVKSALRVFLSLIKDDKDFIINTDPVDDDCPCSELVFDMERKLSYNQNSLDYLLILGMLWLYCDKQKSMKYFKKAVESDESAPYIKSILSLL